MTSADRYSYQPSRYEDLTLIRQPDGSIRVILGKDHAATGCNSESITLPPRAAVAVSEWFGATS